MIMKHYPSVVSTQTAIDGILDQMKAYNLNAKDIANIDIEGDVRAGTVERREAMWNPKTVPECQFSLPYTIATAACDGDVSLDSYTPQARTRKEIRD